MWADSLIKNIVKRSILKVYLFILTDDDGWNGHRNVLFNFKINKYTFKMLLFTISVIRYFSNSNKNYV